MTFMKYRRYDYVVEMRPYAPGEPVDRVKFTAPDPPKLGDMIARDPKHRGTLWLVPFQDFADNCEPAYP